MPARPASDPVAELIPWYVNGTLAEGERKLVEEHVGACAECRDRLREARAFAREIKSGNSQALREHVDPRLLTEYIEQPGALEPETVRFIEERLARCAACRDAHARLLEVAHALAARGARAGRARPSLDRLWSALASTVLRPAPALAYLIALAVLVPALWLARPGAPREPVAATPTRVVVQGDRATRAGAPSGAAAPVEIPGRTALVLLELETELEPDDLAGATSFTLELLRGETVLWSAPASRADVSVRDGRVVVSVVLVLGRLTRGADHTIVLRASRPGDPVDGQAVFSRSLRIPRDGA